MVRNRRDIKDDLDEIIEKEKAEEVNKNKLQN